VNRNLEVELKQEADADEKGPYILQGGKKAVKEIRNTKATGDDDVLGDVLRMSGNDGLQLVIKLYQQYI
jgi:hypothetical protein